VKVESGVSEVTAGGIWDRCKLSTSPQPLIVVSGVKIFWVQMVRGCVWVAPSEFLYMSIKPTLS